MQIAELNIYPLKSAQPVKVEQAMVEPWGLTGDRRWMAVDAQGVVVTARKFPTLLTVAAAYRGDGRLRLTGPHAQPLDVDGTVATDVVPVQVWQSQLEAVHPSATADAWLSALLERDVRLVWLDDPTRRPVKPTYAQPTDRVSFADAFPLLLTTVGSLQQLNNWMIKDALDRDEPAPTELVMRRFRPNVVIKGSEPFVEDTWRRLRIGTVEFRAPKLCDRCVLTTVDPDTLIKGKEPLRTLARYRRWDGKVWFGTNIIPDGTGTLQVGDSVEVLPN